MEYVLPPKLSDEEVLQGKPVRKEYLNLIISKRDTLNSYASSLTPFGPHVVNKFIEYQTFVKNKLGWVEKNIELSVRQVEKERTPFLEKSQLFEKDIGKLALEAVPTTPLTPKQISNFPFQNFVPQLKEEFSKKQNKTVSQEKLKQQEEDNKSYFDKIIEGIWVVIKYIPLLIFLFFALRVASFEVNAILWKPLPFKILKFIYCLLFFFYYIPYYIFVETKAFMNGTGYPRYEGFFPFKKYDPMDQQKVDSIYYKLFGYADTPALNEWIESQIKEDQQKKLDALG